VAFGGLVIYMRGRNKHNAIEVATPQV